MVFSTDQKTTPLSVRLIIFCFPILLFYYNNIEHVSFNQIVPLLLIILLLTLTSLIVAELIFQSIHKAILLGFVGVVVFFSYGYVSEFIMEIDSSDEKLTKVVMLFFL